MTAHAPKPTRRYIRYLAATDASPIGVLALEYLKGLLRIGQVRVGSLSGGLQGPWESYFPLLATAMDGDYVNVVCCDPSRWTWVQEVPMPTRLPNGDLVVSAEVATGRQELYTVGVHNVLLTNESYHPANPRTRYAAAAALRYEEIVVSSERILHGWVLARSVQRRPHLLPVPITVPNALRRVVLPPSF